MKDLMEKLKEQTLQGNDCYLVALIESEGSTPRSSGAYMLVNERGWVAGTVGGGAMEYAAVQEAQNKLAEGQCKSYQKRFDLTPAAGMACGGYCGLQFCYLPANKATEILVEYILYQLAGDCPWWLLLPLGEGEILVQEYLPLKKHQGIFEQDGREYFAQQYNYDGKVFIFGAGHVARELVPLLCHVGFTCEVFDDREEFADPAVFPEAHRVMQVDYTQLEAACRPTFKDYAVVMTRGHIHDANCERFLLKTSVPYIGIMGSRTKAKLAQEALLAEGYSKQDLDRITTPIGLDIGSETPAEIAVSIAAQLIRVRSRRS
ncbi:MAG: XdhC family protein [Phascolarctobacterium sp.]|nr:XdhC family protein [Phascolarctobacterium sp.]